jgi:hypothetical protein
LWQSDLSEEWVTHIEHALAILGELKAKKKSDRLEVIKDLYLVLSMLDRSVKGWQSWIHNLSFMAEFTEDELNEIEGGLIDHTQDFLRFDLDVTKKYPRKMTEEGSEERKEDTRGMYT